MSVARCLAFALGVSMAAPAAMAGGNGVSLNGAVGGSYFYNTLSPTDGRNDGAMGNPFHAKHNEFQFDEAVLDLSRERTDENKVGFRVRSSYGVVGTTLGSGSDGGNGIWLSDAYIDYGCGCGVDVQLGKFGTHIGYETVYGYENTHITRGMTFNTLQPFSQVGLRLSSNIAGVDVMLGAVNGVGENQMDIDEHLDLVWSVGISNDNMALSFNGQADFDDNSGSSTGKAANDPEGLILDVVATAMPTESLSVYVNYTYNDADDVTDGGSTLAPGVESHGINVGGRLGVNDKMGVASRFEWMQMNPDGGGNTSDYISLTGTVDFMLAENLVAKGEVRWDSADDSSPFDAGDDDDQVIVGTSLTLSF